ncbi:hypothetical protein NHF46_13545 [Arthrobacter alpinus]|nr:hypothetical protein [Arthrobacter alpinus]
MRATPEVGDEPANIITDRALEWIGGHKDNPDWYLHLTYWDPHMDYLQDKEWSDRAAAAGPAPVWPDQDAIDAHAEVYGPRSALDLMYSDGMIENRSPTTRPRLSAPGTTTNGSSTATTAPSCIGTASLDACWTASRPWV